MLSYFKAIFVNISAVTMYMQLEQLDAKFIMDNYSTLLSFF